MFYFYFYFQTDVTDVCPNASVLAQQLTHIELERLSFIGPEEFVQAFAKDNPHLETSFKDMKKTRNLESYVSWFNRLSYFVATEVVKVYFNSRSFLFSMYWVKYNLTYSIYLTPNICVINKNINIKWNTNKNYFVCLMEDVGLIKTELKIMNKNISVGIILSSHKKYLLTSFYYVII